MRVRLEGDGSDHSRVSSRLRQELQRLRSARPEASAIWARLQSWEQDQTHEAALALIAATILENALETAIATHFAVNREDAESIFLDQSEGGLSSISMKIKLAYALGVIEKKVRKELTLIKTIRNSLAHASMDAPFSDPEIVILCQHLFVAKELPFGDELGPPPHSAKQRYAKSIELLFAYFYGSVTPDTERVPLLYDDSDFYILAFLDRENYPKGFRGADQT